MTPNQSRRHHSRKGNRWCVDDELLALVLQMIVSPTLSSLSQIWIWWKDDLSGKLKEICPRGNNKVVIYISLYHDKCLLFMLEFY